MCDINNDGYVRTTDLIRMNNIVTAFSGAFSAYDYNNDGLLNENDTVILLRAVTNIVACPQGKTCDVNGNGTLGTTDLLALRVIFYDYDGDGKLTSNDATILLRVVTQIAACPLGKTCDIDGNGVVATTDSIKFQEFIVGTTLGAFTSANSAPSAPTINGAQIVSAGSGQTYSGFSTDTDEGDAITYTIDWGDGSPTETQRSGSGYPYIASHIWTTANIYDIQVTAADGKGTARTSRYGVRVE